MLPCINLPGSGAVLARERRPGPPPSVRGRQIEEGDEPTYSSWSAGDGWSASIAAEIADVPRPAIPRASSSIGPADALAQQSSGNANGTGGAYGAGSTGGSTLGTGSGAGGVRNSGESGAGPTLGTGSGAGGVTSPASSGTKTGSGSARGVDGDAAPR